MNSAANGDFYTVRAAYYHFVCREESSDVIRTSVLVTCVDVFRIIIIIIIIIIVIAVCLSFLFRIHTDCPVKRLSRSSDSPRASTRVTPLPTGTVDRFPFRLKPSKFNGHFRWLSLCTYMCIFSLHRTVNYPLRKGTLISLGLHWIFFKSLNGVVCQRNKSACFIIVIRATSFLVIATTLVDL